MGTLLLAVGPNENQRNHFMVISCGLNQSLSELESEPDKLELEESEADQGKSHQACPPQGTPLPQCPHPHSPHHHPFTVPFVCTL